jgi:prevent-host-death family protein
MKIPISEFVQKLEHLTETASIEPLVLTENGRDRLVVLSVEEYARLRCRDRRVVAIEDVTEEDMALIAKAEVPLEYGYLDDELKGWKP